MSDTNAKVCPREPTDDMTTAGFGVLAEYDCADETGAHCVTGIWQAMYDAAPDVDEEARFRSIVKQAKQNVAGIVAREAALEVHFPTCAVHLPTCRPCSCGLETRLRDTITRLAADLVRVERERDEERAIVARIWDLFGRPSYESLNGKSIYDLIADVQKDARRYRWLRDAPSLLLRSEAMKWTRADGSTFMQTHYLAAYDTQYAARPSLDAAIDAAIAARGG